ncbi:hypothetical protein [Pedobacter sp. SL55]|uniref:hypothetical protein n=1 Tax=Pedobacter sp. SL55 TaxID=2995161 RepID=UPI0022711715|nr:hypothetical protein [Pedobacter sp. SL55]WAC41198.1 hypothetical protein OVA16_02145 [Pedobacter sp. SL55]
MYIGKKDNKIVYEVELTNPENLMVLGQKANRSNLEQEVKKHTIKLLLFEDEKTKKILYASYMSLEKHSKGEFEKLHYKNLGNFTGTVLYYHFTGQLANGWNYTNGRIAEKITVITEKQFDQLQTQTQGDIRTEAIVCQSGFADKYQWTCVGVPGYENCGFTYVGQEYVTYCSYEEEDKDYLGNENESGGGYFPPEYTDCAGVAGGTAIWNNECNTCIGGTTGLTACPPREIIDSLLNNCMKNAKNIIITQNGWVNALLRNFTNDSSFSPNYTWILKNGTVSETDLATTGNWDRVNRNVTTNIDDTKFTNASDLAIVKTILHEGIHAYLIAYFANDPINANKEYSVLFDNYFSIKRPDLNEIHHNEMARIFVDQIAISLELYGDLKGYSFTSSLEKKQFYGDLAWGGLFETKAFKAMSSNEQNRIKTTISVEQKGENLLGQSKIHKGQVGGCQ